MIKGKSHKRIPHHAGETLIWKVDVIADEFTMKRCRQNRNSDIEVLSGIKKKKTKLKTRRGTREPMLKRCFKPFDCDILHGLRTTVQRNVKIATACNSTKHVYLDGRNNSRGLAHAMWSLLQFFIRTEVSRGNNNDTRNGPENEHKQYSTTVLGMQCYTSWKIYARSMCDFSISSQLQGPVNCV